MKIAMVTATFPPYRGGTGNVAYHHARLMHERGHAVTVFTADYGKDTVPSFLFSVRYLKPMFRMGNAPFTPGLIHQLTGFDVIHLHYPYIFGAEATAWAARKNRIPLLITYHNDLVAMRLRGWLFKEYTKWVQPRVLKVGSAVMATSSDYAQYSRLTDIRGLEVHPVPNGVDGSRFVPGQGAWPTEIPAFSPWALFVGALDRAHFFKGLPVLLEAMKNLPEWHSVVVGDGDLRDSYVDQANAIGVSERVHWMGAVVEEQLIGLYQAATVTVLPSTTPGEAFGLVLVESMACGTPVIASDLPGVRSVVPMKEGMGWLAAGGDAEDLARRLRQVHNASARPVSKTEVRRWALERYTWERVGEHLETTYQTAVKKAQTQPSHGAMRHIGGARR